MRPSSAFVTSLIVISAARWASQRTLMLFETYAIVSVFALMDTKTILHPVLVIQASRKPEAALADQRSNSEAR